MAALAMLGAMMSSCSEAIEVSQPANTGKTVMVKTTVSLDENSSTRALDAEGKKTFAVGEQIAVIYENTSNQTVKAVSLALTDDDIDNNTYAHNATFSVPLTNPKPSGDVRYIYPASMAADDVSATTPDNDATIKWTNLATQDGTLTSLASNLDLATFDGNLTESGTLPATAALTNPLTIGAFTIKNNATDGDITNTINKLTISDGTNTYAVTTTTALSTFYVAMQPISDTQTVVVQATDGTTHYVKTVTGKTLAKNKITPVNVKMFTGTPASNVAAANLGDFLGADGFIYANTADATATGTTAVAVIAYVGSVSNYFDKFLAIALTDVDGTHTWTDALTKVGEYAAAHPITIGGTTYNTSTTGDTYYDIVASDDNTSSATATAKQTGWRLPSVTDLRYIFDGLGRQKASLTLRATYAFNIFTYSENATPTDPIGVVDQMVYRNGSNGHSLLAAINTACGNGALQYYFYWLSSSSDKVWVYNFAEGNFILYPKTNDYNVRAVFAY